MDFALSEEQTAIFDMARDFGQENIAPYARTWEEDGSIPKELWPEVGALGLGGIYVSEEYGGSGLSRLDATLVFEALAMACPSVGSFLSIHNMCGGMIDKFGSTEMKRDWLPRMCSMEKVVSYCLTEPGSGSDAAALKTRAERTNEGYALNGTKAFISGGGYSDAYIVMCRSGDDGPKGISTLIVEDGAQRFEREIVWKEIFWADVLEPAEEKFLEIHKNDITTGHLRQYLIHNLGDAAAYRKTNMKDDKTYTRIHHKVRNALKSLREEAGEDLPLFVLAHSLGGHIMSNYIWDVAQSKQGPPPFKNGVVQSSDLENFRTLAGFVTFGCNIPIFTLAYPHKSVVPISYPGSKIPKAKRLLPWWRNYYDRADILGFPLRKISPAYQEMAARGELADVEVEAGPPVLSATTISHNYYWSDRDFVDPLVEMLEEFKALQ